MKPMNDAGSIDPIGKALQRAQDERRVDTRTERESVRSWVQPSTPLGVAAPSFGISTFEPVALDAEHLHSRHILCGTDDEDRILTDRYRLLRTRTLQILMGHGWRSLAITSAGPKAGKSLTTINLAISIAREGKLNVIAIDADIRKPTLASDLGINSEYGLIDFLSSDIPLERVLYQPESIPNLQVLVGRPIIADSVKAEILNSGKMRTLLEQFRATSEPTIVLIDTPPVLLGDDVIVMAPMVDAFMLVVEEGGTQVDDLQKSLELLAEYEIMGTILNNSDEKTHRMEGYYQSDS